MLTVKTSHKFFTKFFRELTSLVPQHSSIDQFAKKEFQDFLTNYSNILVLTGAGISTESGIPDYRSKDVGMFARTSYKPIMYSEFLKNPDARKRYWLRNFVAWPKFSRFSPNKAHYDVFKLQTVRRISAVVTQNVDGLHSKAGSSNIVELHGNAYWVKCLQCGNCISRHDFQEVLKNNNSHCDVTPGDIRPDGDVEIDTEQVKTFIVPDCDKCGGMLKPTIVFFGENIPPKRVKTVEKLVTESDALLVMGTSLSTLSSLRICEQAYDLCKFICIVNIGETRGDKLADLIINGKCSEVFPVSEIRDKFLK